MQFSKKVHHAPSRLGTSCLVALQVQVVPSYVEHKFSYLVSFGVQQTHGFPCARAALELTQRVKSMGLQPMQAYLMVNYHQTTNNKLPIL